MHATIPTIRVKYVVTVERPGKAPYIAKTFTDYYESEIWAERMGRAHPDNDYATMTWEQAEARGLTY